MQSARMVREPSGMMLALNALAAGFLAPLAALVASGQQLQTMGAHLNPYGDVLEAGGVYAGLVGSQGIGMARG